MTPEQYIGFLRTEYLASFLREGGAAVKFAVPHEGVSPDEVHALLRYAAEAEDYVYAIVDSRDVKVHMIHEIFHEIARQVDWQERARAFVRNTLSKMRFRVPDDPGDFRFEVVARLNDWDLGELRRDFQRVVQQDVLRDYEMAQEFRIAMTRLCLDELDRSDPAKVERDNILDWLRGDLRLIGALREALIFQKIARHNAHHVLLSLPRWLVKTGKAGLVLDIDLRRCAVARRPRELEGLYYSKGALLDAYEVLRQLIDATDELASCLVFVLADPEFLDIWNPRGRGLAAYDALRMRVWDEVRDPRRPNPYSTLVRLKGGPSP